MCWINSLIRKDITLNVQESGSIDATIYMENLHDKTVHFNVLNRISHCIYGILQIVLHILYM